MDIYRILLTSLVSNHNPEKRCNFRDKNNIDMAIVYLKWISYVPDFEQERMDSLSDKTVSELTLDELDFVTSFKIQQNMVPIFQRYLSYACKYKDILPVYDFINNFSLEKIMKPKLSKDDYITANEIINNCASLSSDELNEWIAENGNYDNYQNLSAAEAYAYYELQKLGYHRSMDKLFDEPKVYDVSEKSYVNSKKNK